MTRMPLAPLATLLLAGAVCAAHALPAQQLADDHRRPRVALIKMPYSGARNVPEISPIPDYLWDGGIADTLRDLGAVLKPVTEIRLLPQQEADYGAWHRMGMANRHLAATVAANVRDGYLSVGLLANCTSLLGVLGGLQRARPASGPQRVGLVFIDAHGDFNTPETTLSGMLGGMPVAVAAGLALHNLRRESGLDVALPAGRIAIGAARDLDPLERALLDSAGVVMFSTADIRGMTPHVHDVMRHLAAESDLIYVHVDMDVLDPAEVAGHPLTVPGGPTSRELAAALTELLAYEKVAAFGVASTPPADRDPDGTARAAAYALIRGAVAGVRRRETRRH